VINPETALMAAWLCAECPADANFSPDTDVPAGRAFHAINAGLRLSGRSYSQPPSRWRKLKDWIDQGDKLPTYLSARRA